MLRTIQDSCDQQSCFHMAHLVAAIALVVLSSPATAFARSTPPFRLRPQLNILGSNGRLIREIPILSQPLLHRSEARQLVSTLRGGSGIGGWSARTLFTSTDSLFNATLLVLAILTAITKVVQLSSTVSSDQKPKPASVRSLQRRFLPVFWLLRMADWLQGPYFYEVYASKSVNGVPASMNLVCQLFLTGFASTALFGPAIGRATDVNGRKMATLAFCVFYALSALSTKSSLLMVLFLGRMLSGIGTSLLFSAPEAWLVGEAQKEGNAEYLGETFGLAFAGDSLVAVLAGQLAGIAAAQRGPTGPFELSSGILVLGGLAASFLWRENTMAPGNGSEAKLTIQDAVNAIQQDPKILTVGLVQSLFEAAMYIFVLQWPPAMSAAISQAFGRSATTPYGTIFSCFMVCCLLGSTVFGQLTKWGVPTESSTVAMLAASTIAMSGAAWIVRSTGNTPLRGLIAAFFIFETCVGMYFPSISTLRSKYVPDSYRSVIMNLFGIPLNALVIGVFLNTKRLGVQGALSVSACALGLATLRMLQLS